MTKKTPTQQFRDACIEKNIEQYRSLRRQMRKNRQEVQKIFGEVCSKGDSHLEFAKRMSGDFEIGVEAVVAALKSLYGEYWGSDTFRWLVATYYHRPVFNLTINDMVNAEFTKACIRGSTMMANYLLDTFATGYGVDDAFYAYPEGKTCAKRLIIERFADELGDMQCEIAILFAPDEDTEFVDWLIDQFKGHLVGDGNYSTLHAITKIACKQDRIALVNRIIARLDLPPDAVCEAFREDPRLVFCELGSKHAA